MKDNLPNFYYPQQKQSQHLTIINHRTSQFQDKSQSQRVQTEQKLPHLLDESPSIKHSFSAKRLSSPNFTIFQISKDSAYFESQYEQVQKKDIKIREGWVKKKTMFGQKDVYILLTREKLYEYSKNKLNKLLFCICFEFFECELKINEGIEINFKEPKHKIIYTLSNKVDEKQWEKSFQQMISNIYVKYLKINVDKINFYFGKNIITEKQFLNFTDSGDILLFQTDNFGAKLQRVASDSLYDHVAIVLRTGDNIFIFDSNSDTGVTLHAWSPFLETNDLYQKIVIRKLMNIQRDLFELSLNKFVKRTTGMKYLVSAMKLLRKGSLPKQDNPFFIGEEGFFCSELVAQAFKQCNLLGCNKASSSFWPVNFSFAQNLELKNGAYLDKEINIVLERDCKQT